MVSVLKLTPIWELLFQIRLPTNIIVNNTAYIKSQIYFISMFGSALSPTDQAIVEFQ